MIVKLSQQLQQNIKVFQILKDSEGRITKIQQTRNALNALSDGIEQWVEVYPAVAPCLSEQLKLNLQDMAGDILHKIVETRAKVEKDYTANDSLNSLLRKVSDLMDQTSTGWTVYAQRPITALENRAHLARDLPRMQGYMADIEQRINSVKVLAGTLPRHVVSVNIYYQHIEYLERILHDLDGLEEEQKAFLALIHDDRATLEDVTDFLLEWCRREGLAQSLQLRFKDVR